MKACPLCGKTLSFGGGYRLPIKSKEVKVAEILSEISTDSVCSTCWHKVLSSLDKEELLPVLLDEVAARDDAECEVASTEEQIKELEEKVEELQDEVKEKEEEGEQKAVEQFKEGKDEGFGEGKDEGYDTGYDEGFKEGREEGFDEGLNVGREEGYEHGSYGQ